MSNSIYYKLYSMLFYMFNTTNITVASYATIWLPYNILNITYVYIAI